MKKLRRILALLLVVTMMAVNVPMVAQAATCTDGHNYQTEVIVPTCTEGGFTLYTCGECGDSYITDEVDALGHQMVDGICMNCNKYCDVAPSVDGVYEIYTANHLYWFAQEVNDGNTTINGKLMTDITVNTNVLTEDGELNGDGSSFRVWMPIGNENYRYSGIFDGNGKTVSGLYFNNSSAEYVGFFGYTYNASIQNLKLSDSYVYGSKYVGGIVGWQKNGAVSDCSNNGRVKSDERVGGIVGHQRDGLVSNCANSGSVSGSGSSVGGIVGGQDDGAVINCTNSGEVIGDGCVGGIAGSCFYYGEVSKCTNSAVVSGRNYVGGIVGGSYVPVRYCINSGRVSGSSYFVGGIVGHQYDCTVSNCANSGSVSGGSYDVGGIVGHMDCTTVKNCANSGSVNGMDNYVGGIAGEQESCTVSDCYYVYGIVKDGNGTNQFGIGCENKGSYDRDISGATAMKTAAQFASGEVCYLLQQADPDAGWGQEIGVDPAPVLGGTPVCTPENGYVHNLVATVTAPTCTEAGYTTYTCSDCGDSYVADEVAATGHSKDENGICTVCGTSGEIVISMQDSYGDGWNSCKLEIYQDDVLITTATIDSGESSNQVIIGYYPNVDYYFRWVTGSYPSECSFEISLNGETLFSASSSDCESFTYGQVVYTLENACVHSYVAVTTAPTCTEEGYTTYTCTICGRSYQDNVVAALGHSYDAVVTVPTCLEEGYTTYTCTVCGGSYTDGVVPATGHSYGKWVLELIPTCETDGEISTKCIRCEEQEFGELAALGHDYVDGYCTVCGSKDPDYVWIVIPKITMNYPSLSFEDEIYYNVYFTVDDASSVVEMGLITFDSRLTNGSIADAAEVIPGYLSGGGKYMVRSNGIPAKNLGDALYFKVYAKLTDGSYVYSDIAGYHAVAYANSVLNNTGSSAKAKALAVAMLNYGAAAQEYFGYKNDDLMNAGLSADQQALVRAYDDAMVQNVVKADASKIGIFKMNGGYSNIYPTVSFEGAFSINFYFAPSKAVDDGLTFYYWDAKTYASVDVLTAENACGVISMKQDGNNWGAAVEGIAAKDMDSTIYVAGIYTSNGVSYPTSVVAYSLGNYCKTLADGGIEFGAATAVYGFYAKAYFA